MKLYRSKGTTWTGTQADARAIERDFESIEVPTDKPGLLEFLNTFEVRFVEREQEASPEAETPASDPVRDPVEFCPVCKRDAAHKNAKHMAAVEAAICIYADLDDIQDLAVLDRVQAALYERRAALCPVDIET
jgi:hypothetical protein